MPILSRNLASIAAASVVIAIVGCATTPSADALVAGQQATIEGTIASIDTKPWMYDGSAVVLLDTPTQGRVAVQLPARWNLCKAPQVEVTAFAAGQRARATGTVTDDLALVVCERAEHRLEAVN